jgi:Putative Actinobacterial Holin-X, holin superfamily III
MGHMAGGAQPPPAQERSTGELVKSLSEQVSVLVRDEFKLAQLEMTHKGRQAGAGIGMLGGGGLVALYGVGCLLACVIIAISGVVAAWLAALIVGAALLAVAAAVALVGKGRLRKATPPVPAETVSSIKTDVEEIRERAQR